MRTISASSGSSVVDSIICGASRRGSVENLAPEPERQLMAGLGRWGMAPPVREGS
jgi:hypothetical protein